MFRTKQDVDRHAANVLGRIKDEKERNSRGYQIARLYFDVGEYEISKRYLSAFLSVREAVPQAHKLLGQIYAACHEKEKAIAAFKRSLELDGTQKDLILNVCDLCSQTNIDPERAKFWLDKAAEHFPQNEAVFRLKEKILQCTGEQDTRELENLITTELVKRPLDVHLRIKLLRLYLSSGRLGEAYNNAVDTDRTMAFADSMEWYETLVDIYQTYKAENGCHGDIGFYTQNLFALSSCVYLRLCHREPADCADMLHLLDQTLQEAVQIPKQQEEWEAVLAEMQGEFFFLAGSLLLKRAQKGQVSWKDLIPSAAACYLMSNTFPSIDTRSEWFVKAAKSDRAKLYDKLHKNSNFRKSQGGHSLHSLCKGEPTPWAIKVRQQVCTPQGQEKLFDLLFTLRGMRNKKDQSYLMLNKGFTESGLAMPSKAQVYQFDKVAYKLHPQRLSEMVWLALQQYSIRDQAQPNYGFSVYETLQYSVKNVESGAAESLCQLDTETFLYASVRCAALKLQEKHHMGHTDSSEPYLLPVCLCKPLCTQEQSDWWLTAFKFYTNTVKENFSKMRHMLQRGIETVRLVGSHGLSVNMMVHLARSLDRKAKELKEDESDGPVSQNKISDIEARAGHFWSHALECLQKLEKNQTLRVPKERLFRDDTDLELDSNVVQDLIGQAKFATAVTAMKDERFEEAIAGFAKLPSPWASFHTAQIYKTMSEIELSKRTQESQEQYRIMIAKSRDALYLSLDQLRGDKNHELNKLLSRELDDIESQIQRTNAATEWDEGDSDSWYQTPSTSRIEEDGSISFHYEGSTGPRLKEKSPSARVKLDMSDTRRTTPVSHLRPSPERLDAQIRSLTFSQESLLKMVLERNEELVKINREMVEELRDSRELITQLRTELNVSQRHSMMGPGYPATPSTPASYLVGSPYRQPYPYTPQAGWAPQYGYQMPSPGGLPGYRVASPRPGLRHTLAGHPSFSGKPGQDENVPVETEENDDTYFISGEYYDESLAHPHAPQNQYYVPESQLVQDWPFGHRAGIEGNSTITYAPQIHPQMPQTGYFASALRGPSLQYTCQGSNIPASMPGPGFFSSPQTAMSSVGGSQTPLVAALIGKSSPHGSSVVDGCSVTSSMMPPNAVANAGMQSHSGVPSSGGSSMQQYLGTTVSPTSACLAATLAMVNQPGQKPLFSLGNLGFAMTSAANPVPKSTPASCLGSSGLTTVQQSVGQTAGQTGSSSSGSVSGQGTSPQTTTASSLPAEVMSLFQGKATFTSKLGKKQEGMVKVFYLSLEKRGRIRMETLAGNQIILSHDVSSIKLIPTFTPQLVTYKRTLPEGKGEEMINLNFEVPEVAQKLRTIMEKIIESGKKAQEQSPPKTAVSFGSSTAGSLPLFKSSTPSTTAPSSQNQAKTVIPIASSLLTALASKHVDASKDKPVTSAGKPTLFGGFTFTSTPIVKPPEEKVEAPQTSPGFRLKESTLKVATSPNSGSPGNADQPKPFAGFSFTPKSFGTSAASTDTPPGINKGSGDSVAPQPSANSTTFVLGQNAHIPLPSFSGVASSPGKDAFKQKESFKGFQNSGQQLFQKTSPAKPPGHGEDDEKVDEYEPNVDFKPVIELPDLVEVKTGEEDEKKLFGERARLFRFDSETGQWKERGVGEMKILQMKCEARFRILMRREQVLKICANHYISKEMKLTPMASSDRAWCWAAMDYAEEEMKVEQLAVKFKTPELASSFKDVFESCQKLIEDDAVKSAPETIGSSEVAQDGKAANDEKQSTSQKSLSNMFKPKAGSWECTGCYCRNEGSVLRCPACQTLKPGTKPEDVTGKEQSSNVTVSKSNMGGFSFGGTGGFKFGQDSNQRERSKDLKTDEAAKPNLSSLFKPKEGSWECTGCYCRNDASVLKCPACQAPKPGTKSEEMKADSSSASKISFGGAGGFSFKGFHESSASVSSSTDEPAASSNKNGVKPPLSSVFKPKEGSWECNGCYCRNDASVLRCPACQTQKPGTKAEAPKEQSSGPTKVSFGNKGGFSFGGLKFGESKESPATIASGSKATAGFKFSETAKKDSKPAVEQVTSTTEGEKGPLMLVEMLKSNNTALPAKEGYSFASQSSPASSGFNFNTPSKESGFQFKLGNVSTPVGNLVKESEKKSPFQFTFSLTPSAKGQPGKPSVASPKSPEVSEEGFYLNKEGDDSHIYFEPVVPLPDKIEVKTGEEEESILFEHRCKLYRFVTGEWKERGIGNIKILEHKETKRIRILMRREQVLKICCNHFIGPDIELKSMMKTDGKAWVWYALDFSDEEQKVEQFSVRFKNAEIANKFKDAFECAKAKVMGGDSSTVREEIGKEEVSDVIFVKQEVATEEQIARARKYQLPDHFYLYEQAPPCPGCIGCDDYDPTKPVSTPSRTKTKAKLPAHQSSSFQPSSINTSSIFTTGSTTSGMFESNSGLSFSTLAAQGDACGHGFAVKKDDSKPFTWAGAGQTLFGMPSASLQAGDDSDVIQAADIHFEPIIPLPDLVEVKTGEEGWEVLFSQRSKLYRFDKPTSQWKERAIGEMKILKQGDKYRLLMRREQVLKVACNHLISAGISLSPMSTSETAWCWVAQDYSEGEAQLEQFAVKFKNQALAKQFKDTYEECQRLTGQSESSSGMTSKTSNSNNSSTENIVERKVQEETEEVEEDDDDESTEDDDDDDDEEEEEEDEESILFDKRVTLFCADNVGWKKLGMGNLRVLYNDDVNGDSIQMDSDEGQRICNHVICREHHIKIDKKQRSCEWSPIDFSTDEPVRRHFKAVFSSPAAAEEYEKVFRGGRQLAVDSELSENITREMDMPEVFSRGDAKACQQGTDQKR